MSKLEQALQGKTQPREVSLYERFRGQINLVRKDIAGLVGETNVDRFVRVCLNAVQANPAVLNADRRSLLLSCLRAAQDKLLPDGREAVLNVFNTKVKVDDNRDVWVEKVQYMPMAYGLIQKIYDAGATFVDAVPVFEKDEFTYTRGDDPKIVHVPFDKGEPGAVKAAYIIVKLKTGETKREVMFRWEIDRVREKSKAKDGLMWKDFFDQAAVKSVIHRIIKQLPRSDTLERALAADNEATGLVIEGEATAVVETGSDLEAILAHVPVDPKAAGDPKPGASQDKPASTSTAPKRGDRGTPELRDSFVAAFAAAKDIDALGIKRDEVNFYQWTAPDLTVIDDAYKARVAALAH